MLSGCYINRPCGKVVAVNKMRYQLVLQFAADSLEDYDRLVALEDRLIEELAEAATVDGHDFGLGKFNIFILADDPAPVFDRAHGIIVEQGVPNVLQSAYREINGEDYIILWPSSLTDFNVL